MGQHVVTSASGQGSESLGGTFNLTELDIRVITLADFASATGPAGIRRIHQQGWVGVGITPDGGPFVGVVGITRWRYVEQESDIHVFDTGAQVPADTIYWDIQPGGEVLIEVDW